MSGSSGPAEAARKPAAYRAAGQWERVRAQAGFEVRNVLSNGEQLLVSMVLPLIALATLTWVAPSALMSGYADADPIAVAVPGVLALAVVSTAFTGQAILLAYERRYGVLRLLGTTPLGRGGLLVGKGFAVLVVVAIQSLVLSGTGLALGWRPRVISLPTTVLLVVLGCAVFAALAAVVGGRLRAEAVLAVANLAWVLFLGCGLLLPLAAFPDGVATLLHLSPPGALGEGLRAASLGTARDVARPVLVLLAWATALAALAARVLRWSD